MSAIVSLDKFEYKRECEIFSNPTLKSWKDLNQFFESKWPANDPGSVGSIRDYEYENNGDYPPTEPWVEPWVSDSTLRGIWKIFKEGSVKNFFEYVYKMSNEKGISLYNFSNAQHLGNIHTSSMYVDFKKASRKQVPKAFKKMATKLLGGKARSYFFNSNGNYAVQHPKYDFLITEDKSIIVNNIVLLFAL